MLSIGFYSVLYGTAEQYGASVSGFVLVTVCVPCSHLKRHQTPAGKPSLLLHPVLGN